MRELAGYVRRLRAPVAQRIEQQPSNLSVPGSNPGGGAYALVRANIPKCPGMIYRIRYQLCSVAAWHALNSGAGEIGEVQVSR
jgi:hypothetical protein